MPLGVLKIADEAVVILNGARFSSGTIDFDIKPLGFSDTGIIFHRHDSDGGEFVYLRADPDCPAANDCIQYAPITHGLMQWDIYSNYQAPAPIATSGWNHVRLEVTGPELAVFINGIESPSLLIPEMQGLTSDGGLAFKGPAEYANLVMDFDTPPRSFDISNAAVTANGSVLDWLTAPATAISLHRSQAQLAMPGPSTWLPIAAEKTGLVNFSRSLGACEAPLLCVAWIKTTVEATAPMRRTLYLGWARQISVFVNGVRVYYGENPYRPVERRLQPDGRLETNNASVPLDLRRGRNEIVLGVGNAWRTESGALEASPYGWAAEAHFEDVRGIVLR